MNPHFPHASFLILSSAPESLRILAFRDQLSEALLYSRDILLVGNAKPVI